MIFMVTTTLWFELTLIVNSKHDKSLIFFFLALTEEKMGATRVFIFSTFLVLMFGFALSLPTEDPEQGKYKLGREGISYYLS